MKILFYIAGIIFILSLPGPASGIQFNQPFHIIDDNQWMSYLHAQDITKRDKHIFRACKAAVKVKVKGPLIFSKDSDQTVMRLKHDKKLPDQIDYQVAGIFNSETIGKSNYVCEVTLKKNSKGKMEIFSLNVGGLWEMY